MSDNGLVTFTKACGCMMDSRTNTLVDACKFHAAEAAQNDLKKITPGALAMLKIQHRVNDARCQAMRRRGSVAWMSHKPHFQLRAILGKFSGQIWWAVVAGPDQLKSATRHPNSGKAIREQSHIATLGGRLRPTDAGLAAMPTPATPTPNDRWIKHE